MGGEARDVKLGVADARIGAEEFRTELEAAPVANGVLVSGVIDDGDVLGMVRRTESGPVLFTRGRAIALKRPEYGHALEGLAAGDDIRAPMPGKLLEVKAVNGAEVKKGDPLVVMEAMKMEHTLAAPRDGKIIEVNAKAGAQTTEGAVLVKLEPLPE
jgi:acetyl/propionyl-CoA carboxylase alpha subunit